MSIEIGDKVRVKDSKRIFVLMGFSKGVKNIPDGFFMNDVGTFINPIFCEKFDGDVDEFGDIINDNKISNIVCLNKKVNQDAIDILKDLIVKIEAGNITGVSIVHENSDGTYAIAGSNTLSRLQTAGLLLDLAINRLGQ